MTRLALPQVRERPSERLLRLGRGAPATSVTGLKVFGSEGAGAVLLSAVAGYVDTAGFIALFGLFTAHITGDLVTAGTSLTERLKFGAGTRLVMIPVFMVSVAATTLLARALRRGGKATLPPMLFLMTAALSIFCITGVTLRPLANQPDAWAVIIIGAAGVVAMGIQNTLMRNVLSGYSPTTIMTGNLTQCTIDLVEIWLPSSASGTEGRRFARCQAGQRLKKFGFPLLGFMVGAFAGAWLTHAWGLASIAVPTCAVGVVALEAWSSEVNAARRAKACARLDHRQTALCRPAAHTHPQCVGASMLRREDPTKLEHIARSLRWQPTARSGTYPRAKYPSR